MVMVSASPKTIKRIAIELLKKAGDKTNRVGFLEMDRRNDIRRILYLAVWAMKNKKELYLTFDDMVILGMVVDFVLGDDF